MSRLGKTAIPLPKGVTVTTMKESALQLQGSKGSLPYQLPQGFVIRQEGSDLFLEKLDDSLSDAMHGLHRALLRNAITGVSQGFEVKLTLIGVGYRAAVQGSQLELQLGFSHPTSLPIPKSLQIFIEKGTQISVKGMDKKEVGQFAASIRAMKPPEPYKGKGIRYENEFVRKKEGKAAKTKGA